ncbi:WD40/YVTN/BNR-like repeat-containing protein [Chloroflexota bacterium]
MKNRMFGKMGVGLAVALLFGFSSLASPASAGTASWSAEAIPGTTGIVLGPAGVDVRDIAVAAVGATVYAVPGDSVSDNVVYKSIDTGVSWTALDVAIEADLVAIAPDKANMIAIVSENTSSVYLTTDGGSTWNSLVTPQESDGAAAAAIYDIAISAASDGVNYIAVAGKEAGDVANVWYINIGAVAPAWQETNALAGFSSAEVVKAVAFSPDFSSDRVLVAVTEKDSVSVDFQMLNVSSEKWNAAAGYAGYPVAIASDDGLTDLTSASISLDTEYTGSSTDRRIAFVGLTVDGDTAARATSGIYRLKDISRDGLKTGVNIHSLAYDGANLIAGAYDNTTVYRSADPQAVTPAINTVSSLDGPGGESKVVVARAGGDVVAGTSGNESAFAISRNKGATFNDISLIDTSTTNVRDVAVSADGSKVYLATDDGADLSLWLYVSSWERVLGQRNTADYIVRPVPDNYDVVYVAKKGAKTIYYNRGGGATQWFARACGVDIQDLAVESAEVVYALESGGAVSKSTNGGFTWGTAEPTRLESGATIVSVSENNLLVGSQDGYVAYSTDGNASWIEAPVIPQSGAGKVQVVADKDFVSNRIIYAASDTGGRNINRWQVGSSTGWTDIISDGLSGGIYGLAVSDNGTLYALMFDSVNNRSALWQCLSPTEATSLSSSWSARYTTALTDADDDLVRLNATPQALKVSSSDKLWAVKTNGINKLYSFTVIMTGLDLQTPAHGFRNPVNLLTGVANEIAFSWSRTAEATEYELYIAYDEDCTELVTTVTVASDLSTVVVPVGLYEEGDARVGFTAGKTYYWRVRVTQPLYSLYSTTRSFTVEPMRALVLNLLTPENGSPDASQIPSFSWEPVAGATEYRFVLADNVTLASPVVEARVVTPAFALNRELDYGKTYYWAVKPVAPVEGPWSVVANFTVKERPVELLPPLVVEQAPTPVIVLPEPPPPQPGIVFSPPLPTPAPVTPAYIWAVIIIGAVLMTAVIVLVVRTFKLAEVGGPELGKHEEGQPISFAVESFLWMLTSGEEGGGERILSADEEKELGQIIASRIRNMAKDQLLYQKFPKDASLFLYLWSHYGSRDETNLYLTGSFKSSPGNVIEFLKSFLPAPQAVKPASSTEPLFDRTQYESVAKVVDPENVVEELEKLYGAELDMLGDEELGDSPDKTIAHQFARIHYLVKSDVEKADSAEVQI